MNIAIDINNKCNLNCDYCYALKYYDKTWNKIEVDIKKIKFLLKAFEDKNNNIALLGGEPFLHKNINEVIQILNSSNYKNKYIFTNFLQKNEIYEQNLKNTNIILRISMHWKMIKDKKFFLEKIKKLKLKNFEVFYILHKKNFTEINNFEKEILSIKNFQLLEYVIDKDSWSDPFEGFCNLYLDNFLSKNLKNYFQKNLKIDINEDYSFTYQYFNNFTKNLLCTADSISIDVFGNVNALCRNNKFNIFKDINKIKKLKAQLKKPIICPKNFCDCSTMLIENKKSRRQS
jgi:MoaA/NifB/PqqE/SkfB family radical SAM enzyme